MMSLKDNCVAQNSKFPYIKSLTGGKDNSIEKLQVGHFTWVSHSVVNDRRSMARHTLSLSSLQTQTTGITMLSTTRCTRPLSRRLNRWSRQRPCWILRMGSLHEGVLMSENVQTHCITDNYVSQAGVEDRLGR